MPTEHELRAARACAPHSPEHSQQCSCPACCQAEDGWPRSPFETRSPFSRARPSGLGLPPPLLFPGAPTLPTCPAGPPPFTASEDLSSLSCLLGMTDSLFALSPLPLPATRSPLSTSTLSATSTCTPFSGTSASGASASSAATANLFSTLLDPHSTGFSPSPHPKPLHLLHLLGRGSYGSVYAALVAGDPQAVVVAAKLFHDKPDAVAACRRELRHLALANTVPHPNITALISSPSPDVILQSYVPNGTLDSYLYSSTPSEHLRINQLALARQLGLPPSHPLLAVPPQHGGARRRCGCACSVCGGAAWRLSHACCAAEYVSRLCLLLSVASGLRHLHSLPCHMIHRDLKPENILLGADGEGILSDFGLAVALSGGEAEPACRPPTTVQYAAPEDLNCESAHTLGTAADVYSFGVVMWEMMSGSRPWEGIPAACAFYHVATQGARLEVPVEWPAAVTRVLAACFCSDPAGRPTSHRLTRELGLEIQRVVNMHTPF